jgi:hypothetical protein
MSKRIQLGVPVKLFDAATVEELGVVHAPLPVEVGDTLALDDHPWPLEVVDVIPTRGGARVAALVMVRPAFRSSEFSCSGRGRVGCLNAVSSRLPPDEPGRSSRMRRPGQRRPR